MTWFLDNGVDRHNDNPDTFEIPEEWEINSLKPGDYAKLIFLVVDGGAERMWVQITGVTDGVFVGTLANNPLFIESLSFGDKILFSIQNIIDIDNK